MNTTRLLLPLLLSGGLAGVVISACQNGPEDGAPPAAPLPERQSVAVTVYSGAYGTMGRAMIKDTRRFDLDAGVNDVRFDDVTSGIIPGSVYVDPGDDLPVAVHEQNYEYDIVSTQRLLQRFVGETIHVTTADGIKHSGTLLSAGDDVIIAGGTGAIVALRASAIADMAFPELPHGLASRPSLRWLLETPEAGDRDLTVTYLTSGFGWSADYVVTLAPDDAAVDLSGWVSVANASEATFTDAQLKLVAGDVNLVPVDTPDAVAETRSRGDSANQAKGGERPVERSFFAYHLYEMPRPVTLAARETKQVEFADHRGIPAAKTYELSYDGSWPGSTVTRHPTVAIEITNDEASGLGIPLPRGVVRVYKNDIDGAAELVGESTIEHTPIDEPVRLTVGQAFDVVGEWKQTEHRVVGYYNDQFTYEATVRNHRDEDVHVTVKHQPYVWWEWKMIRSSVAYTRPDQHSAEFEIEVPAGGETTFTYTLRSSG